jgi:hypothetical protein
LLKRTTKTGLCKKNNERHVVDVANTSTYGLVTTLVSACHDNSEGLHF